MRDATKRQLNSFARKAASSPTDVAVTAVVSMVVTIIFSFLFFSWMIMIGVGAVFNNFDWLTPVSFFDSLGLTIAAKVVRNMFGGPRQNTFETKGR